MVEPTPLRRPVNWEQLRPDDAERIVQERAQDSSNVIFSDHAFDRSDERTIPQPDAYRILRTGYVEGSPVQNLDGDWEVNVVKRMPGSSREAGVAVVIFREGEDLFVKTVKWMDVIR
jgi:hypothetical protein